MNPEMEIGTNLKALQINLDSKMFVTFAEIGVRVVRRRQTRLQIFRGNDRQRADLASIFLFVDRKNGAEADDKRQTKNENPAGGTTTGNPKAAGNKERQPSRRCCNPCPAIDR
jgi:hypothetical protein